MMAFNATREYVQERLERYGEDAVGVAVLAMSEADWERWSELAFTYACGDDRPNFDKAMCLAAVEIVAGAPRPLARKRQRR